MDQDPEEAVGPAVASGDTAAEAWDSQLIYRDLVVRMLGGENLLEALQEGPTATKSGKGSKVSPSVQGKLATVEMEMARLSQDVVILRQVQQHLNSVETSLNEESKLFQNKQAQIEEIMRIVRTEYRSIAAEIVQRVQVKKEKVDHGKKNEAGQD